MSFSDPVIIGPIMLVFVTAWFLWLALRFDGKPAAKQAKADGRTVTTRGETSKREVETAEAERTSA